MKGYPEESVLDSYSHFPPGCAGRCRLDRRHILQKKIYAGTYRTTGVIIGKVKGDRDRVVFAFNLITMVRSFLNLGGAGIGILSNYELKIKNSLGGDMA